MSTSEVSVEDSPIMAIRLVEASGSIIIGALPTLGSACAWVIRSGDHLAGGVHVGAGLEEQVDDRQAGHGGGVDRSSQGTPLSRSCSMPSVMKCSTSAADRPSASVWISTVGGMNSG